MDEEEDTSSEGQMNKKQGGGSPSSEKLTLPKSPVKRMRQLEEQQNR